MSGATCHRGKPLVFSLRPAVEAGAARLERKVVALMEWKDAGRGGGGFRVVETATLRRGFDRQSEAVGTLQPGERVEALVPSP